MELLQVPSAPIGASCSSELTVDELTQLFPQLDERETFSDDESDGSSIESEEDGIVRATFQEMISGKVALDPKSAAKKRRQSQGVRFGGGHIQIYERQEQEYAAMHGGRCKPFFPSPNQDTNVSKKRTDRFRTVQYKMDVGMNARIALRKAQELHREVC
jgi:hypothetical protein